MDGRAILRNSRFSLPLEVALSERLESIPDGKELILGVRPEHINVIPEQKEDAIPAEVYVLEPQSNELILDLEMGEQILKARDDKKELGFRPQVGQRVWMAFVQDAVHVFDKETEERL
jgi:ABC-type sugar transport system ATPase subunit